MSKPGLKLISEEEIIRGCSEGNEMYSRLLYEKYFGKMINVCRRYTKNHDEARDMVQEGFIRVFKSIRQYKGEGSFEGWLRRIMINTCINYYNRYSKKEKELIEYVDHIKLTSHENSAANNFDKDFGHAVQHSDAEFLLRIIQELPPSFRITFNLHEIEGYSHAEIASQLKITESAVRSYLVKARQRLQQMIHTIHKI
jgi:RNA polymerase sigma-70 factor (ECF subfamily)